MDMAPGVCLRKAFPMQECSDRNGGGKAVRKTRRKAKRLSEGFTPGEIVMIVSAFC